MFKYAVLVVALGVATATTVGAAGPRFGALEKCTAAALSKYPGTVQTLEAEIEKGKPIYELDILAKDGKEWEVECDATTGKILETEEEVAEGADAFKSKAKLSLDEAKAVALAKYPGEVVEVEYSLESDGTPVYELDIVAKSGKEWEVEVDAVSGKIVEVEEETFQIGKE